MTKKSKRVLRRLKKQGPFIAALGVLVGELAAALQRSGVLKDAAKAAANRVNRARDRSPSAGAVHEGAR